MQKATCNCKISSIFDMHDTRPIPLKHVYKWGFRGETNPGQIAIIIEGYQHEGQICNCNYYANHQSCKVWYFQPVVCKQIRILNANKLCDSNLAPEVFSFDNSLKSWGKFLGVYSLTSKTIFRGGASATLHALLAIISGHSYMLCAWLTGTVAGNKLDKLQISVVNFHEGVVLCV